VFSDKWSGRVLGLQFGIRDGREVAAFIWGGMGGGKIGGFGSCGSEGVEGKCKEIRRWGWIWDCLTILFEN
jgi:hypothetical protein